MTAIAVIFSDAHLDTHAWKNRPALVGDSFHAWRFIREHATVLNVPMIGAGDLIDVNKPPSAVVNFLSQELYTAWQDSTTLYYTQGQHELADPPWISSLGNPSAKHMHGESLELQGTKFYFLDWTPADKLQKELQAIPEDVDILICHQVWEEFMGTVIACEGSIQQVPNVSMVFTGDFHETRQTSVIGADGQEIKIYSPGSTNMRSISEPSRKYFYVLHDDLSVETVEIPSRDCMVITIDHEDILAEHIERWSNTTGPIVPPAPDLPEELQTPIVYVKYVDEVANVVPAVRAEIGDRGHVFFKRMAAANEDQVNVSEEERLELLEKGLAGCLDLMVDQDSDHYLTLVRLLNADDPKLELQTLKQERGL